MKIGDVVQSADWKTEKHVPVIDVPESVKKGEKVIIEVSVGKEIPHPNTTEHHIRWIKLYFKPDNGKFPIELGTYQFDAHGESTEGANKGAVYTEPEGKAVAKLLTSGTLMALAYCNIHGLWESAKKITVAD